MVLHLASCPLHELILSARHVSPSKIATAFSTQATKQNQSMYFQRLTQTQKKPIVALLPKTVCYLLVKYRIKAQSHQCCFIVNKTKSTDKNHALNLNQNSY